MSLPLSGSGLYSAKVSVSNSTSVRGVGGSGDSVCVNVLCKAVPCMMTARRALHTASFPLSSLSALPPTHSVGNSS